MNGTSSLMRPVGHLFLVFTASCTHLPDPPQPRAAPHVVSTPRTPSAPSIPTASATASTAPIDWQGVSSFTDPKALAALALDCHAAPPQGGGYERDPLSCRLEMDQSCVPDICFEEDQSECRPRCSQVCDSCASTCASSCDTCKAACADDACRAACANRCGACRQGCLKTLDDCTTGDCGKARAECRARIAREWKEGRCSSVCPRLSACTRACASSNAPEECAEKCSGKKVMGQCPEKFAGYCLFDVKP